MAKEKDGNARMEDNLVQLQCHMENLETGNNLESIGLLRNPSLVANSGFVSPHLSQVKLEFMPCMLDN